MFDSILKSLKNILIIIGIKLKSQKTREKFIDQQLDVNGGAGGRMFIRLTLPALSLFGGSSVSVICCDLLMIAMLSSQFVSSSETSELRSEFDGDGDCCKKFSCCSCIIVRNSWIDSFNAHSCDNNDTSNWRRPYCNEKWERRKNKISILIVERP